MFGIHWGYALANVLVFILVYSYIGHFNPGVFPGKCIGGLLGFIVHV